MSRVTRRRARAAVLVASALGAVSALGAAAAEPPFSAPPAIRGTLVLEPSRLALGDVALLEIDVVTPPGFTVHEAGPPPETPGFWLLASEPQPVEKAPGRWIHRTRLRVRARALGEHAWPAWPMVVESPEGVSSPLVIEGRAIAVRSVLNEIAGREGPFGLRSAPGALRGGDALVPALVGALVTLALVGLVALVRRERRRRSARAPELARAVGAPGGAPWQEAQQALELAAQRPDPNACADAAAATLRRYLARRYGVSIAPFTTEELTAGGTPFAVRSDWPRYLALLAELDALRFPPAPAEAGARAAAALTAARALIADSTPREDARSRLQDART